MSFSHIINKDKFDRAVDFQSLTAGAIRPCDVDLSFEFDNKVFIQVEFKEGSKSVPRGQYWAMQRTVDTLAEGLQARADRQGYMTAQEAGMAAMFIVAEHPDVAIPDAASSKVRGIYYQGVYSQLDDKPTLADVLFRMGTNLNNDKLKAVGQSGLDSLKA